MSETSSSHHAVRAEIAELRAQLEEAQEMLRAIRAGEVDALVVEGESGPRLFSLQGLDAEQNRLRGEMLGQVSDAVIAVDLEERVTFLNAAAERQYGVTAADVLGRPLAGMHAYRWVHPDDEGAALTALREQGKWRGENLHVTHDGRVLHVESTVSLLRGPDGSAIGSIAAIRDISERKQAEAALRASEGFNRSLMDGSADCVKVLDLDGRLLQMNAPGLCLMEIDDFGPLCGQEWSTSWPADARPDIERSIATARGGGTYAFEAFCPTAKGTPRWWDVVVSPVHDSDGRVVRLLSVSRDITVQKQSEAARRESQERVRLASEAAQLGFWSWRPDDDLVVWENEYPDRILGVTVGSPPVTAARFAAEFVHPDDLVAFQQALSRTVHAHEPFAFTGRIRRPDGETRWIEFSGASFESEEGERARRILGTVQDVTERILGEQHQRAQTQFLHRIAEVTPGILHVFDVVEGRSVFINQAVDSVLGFRPEEVQAMGADVVRSLMHPEDVPRFERHLARVRALADGAIADFEFRMRDRTDAWHWFQGRDTVFARDAAGVTRQLIGVATDITERKQAEEALTRLAAIVESSHDALFGEDLDGIVTSWNGGAEQIFGYRADELVGTSIMRLIPEALQAEEHERQRQIAAGERGGTFEAIRQAKDGRQFPAAITISPLKNAAGNVIGTSRVVRDITDQKRVEAALRENAALFSTLVAQAPTGTYVVDAQFRLRQVNEQARPMFASVEPLLGRDFNEVLHQLWGPDVGTQCAAIFRRTLETGEPYSSPPFAERRHDLGFDQSYEWETQRITLPDGQYGVVCYFHEVTEREHAVTALRAGTERLRLAADATGIGVWEWHLRTNRMKWDAQMFRLYGMAPTADGYLDYDDWRRAVLPEELAANEAILQETVRRCGRSSRTFRIRRRDDGACRDIDAVEVVRTNAAGEAEWVLGTNLDITARQQTDDELRRLTAALVAADRRKDAFLATLSHELRNPLAAIRTGIHLGRLAGDDRAKVEQNCARMERQVGMLVRLLDDLMDVSRISQDKLTLQTQRLDLASIVHRAIETNQPVLEGRGHPVTVVLPPQPIPVDGDATRLVQALGNLLTNAAKYSDAGNPISLTVESDGDVAEIRVRDCGIGIASADLPYLFEMFRQVDSARDRAHGGLGIGLHLVKRLVEMHGGAVEAHSEGLGRGSEFRVRLPVAPTLMPELSPDGERQGIAPQQTRRLRILVADDNEDAASTLAELLAQLGHDVRTAQNGVQAAALAATMPPDVALLDIGMPELTGDEVGRRIRALPGGDQVVLIAVTGWGQDEDKARSHAAGFDLHLVKPVDPAALEAMLRSLTSSSSRQPSDSIGSEQVSGPEQR